MKGMNRRDFLKAVGLSATLGFPGAVPASEQRIEGSSPPNILVLFTDDQRFSTLNALNNPAVKTPNMDRLMRRGTTFPRAHIMGSMSGAVCMPSRAMLMTGRTLFHLQDTGRTIPREHVMLPERLQKAGYRTFGIGKWHNGAEAFARAFTDGAKIFFGGMSNHLKVPVHDFDPSGKYPNNKRYIGEKFSSELFSDAAIAFLREYKQDNPFFLYVSYTAPHDPRMAPKEYAELYPPEKVELPKNFLPRHPFDNGEMEVRDEKLAPWPRTPKIAREHIAAYYAMITHVDAQIGRVLDALEESGRADNTIIVFAGDNGLAVGQHGLLGKQNLYDHSVRVPLVMCGPGVPRGERRDAFCYLLDVYPTLCHLLGIALPPSVEGKNLVPVLRDETRRVRETLFLAYKTFQRAIRTDRWKLLLYNVKGEQTTQLFNMKEDPWERNDLSADSTQAERIRKLRLFLKESMRTLDDPCDLDKPSWGIASSEKA